MQLIGNGSTVNSPPLLGIIQTQINTAGATAQAGVELGATRRTNSNSAASAVANGDPLGRIQWLGDDGTNLRTVGAYITSTVDTTNVAISTGVMPANLVIGTSKNAPITFQINAANVANFSTSGLNSIGFLNTSATASNSGNGMVQRFRNGYATAGQTPAATTRTYITGSDVGPFTAGQLAVGTIIHWHLDITKTAAGTASSDLRHRLWHRRIDLRYSASDLHEASGRRSNRPLRGGHLCDGKDQQLLWRCDRRLHPPR